MNKKYIIAGIITLSVNMAKASPRTDYLAGKLETAYSVELQAKNKYLAERQHYQASRAYTASLRRELNNVRKREQKELEQARKAASAEYLHVSAIDLEDMMAPTEIKWSTR
jgi:molecular chaperone GrpE (heat shock protein)